MIDKLNLGQAADLLAELTSNPRIKGDAQGIIRAGAKGEFPVYWFNDLKISTWISNFKNNLPRTETCGPVQLTRISLRELAAAEPTAVMDFELSDQDFDLLGQMKGRAVDDEENLFVFRHPATTNGLVTITRDQLFIHESDLRAYAATVATDASVKPKAETTKQRQEKRYQMCVDAGLTMPANDYQPMPRGVGVIAKKLKITRQALVEDLKKHITRK